MNTQQIAHFYWQMLHVNQVPSLCDFSRWISSSASLSKRSKQCLHEYGFATVWIRTWRFRSSSALNIFPQYKQWYRVVLLCARSLCFCNPLELLKLLLHSEHLYGLSSVWTLTWVFRCPQHLNALPHMWHLYGFSPLWILLCTARSPAVVNCLLQTLHSNGFSPEWLRLCTARW